MHTAALALALLLVAIPGRTDPALDPAPAMPSAEAPAGTEPELEALLEDEFLAETAADVPDPVEPWNRGVLWLNRGLDKVLFTPITKTYGFLMPDAGKRGVRRFFRNLSSPPILVNDLLQAEGKRALVTGTRFVVNTTVGILGFFDPAASIGLERHVSDFGQTLFLYGVRSGPYLVLPLFGPSSARDSLGMVVDVALRPDLWLLGGAQVAMLGVGEGLSLRELHQEDLERLEQSALDYYAALRSVYWMDRERFLEDSRLARELRAREAGSLQPLSVAGDGSEATDEPAP